ncbi:MAG: ComF family protein [bacterium]
MTISSIKTIILDLVFPKICFGCGREGAYICDDCVAVIDISRYRYCLCSKPAKTIEGGKCHFCQSNKLDGILSPVSYETALVKNIVKKFKYEPLVRGLSKELASIIDSHFKLLDDSPNFSGFVITAIPMDNKRLRWRGYNQAEELAKAIATTMGLKTDFRVLKKIKSNLVQADLDKNQRKENVRGIFMCLNKTEVKGKNILIIDDIYTTGATMEEAATVLKEAGAKKVWGVVFARG